jgi:hypothetical protein
MIAIIEDPSYPATFADFAVELNVAPEPTTIMPSVNRTPPKLPALLN